MHETHLRAFRKWPMQAARRPPCTPESPIGTPAGLSWAAMVLAALLVMSLCGCRTYGGRSQRVTLISDPPGATAYVITYDEWLKSGGDKQPLDTKALESHRVKDSCTPVTVEVQPYEQVFVADWNGHWEYIRFIPKAGKQVKVYNSQQTPP